MNTANAQTDMIMLNKHAVLIFSLFCSPALFANVPIESRGLSSNATYATSPTAINTQANVNNPTNINWQIMQKNQQLENDIRTLRGKIEEQDNIIEQLKHEMTNRYADLDQRLELLLQKVDPDAAQSSEDNQQDSTPSS